MSRSVLQPSQQKLAEKLTILNDWVVGMVTRLYNIKKVRTGRRGLGGGGGQAEAGGRAGEAWALGAAGGGRPAQGRRDAPRPNAEPWRLSRRVAGRPGAERSHLPAPSNGNWPARRGLRKRRRRDRLCAVAVRSRGLNMDSSSHSSCSPLLGCSFSVSEASLVMFRLGVNKE
uniref:Uncharacterized protein n=1 Tax=Rangifer tarandus platyrhynchus TaxID=3082113 RepID=A0ACB0E219_RANTA|nr:unnamed protein product [Rangifer tarandus platyrhynchus]